MWLRDKNYVLMVQVLSITGKLEPDPARSSPGRQELKSYSLMINFFYFTRREQGRLERRLRLWTLDAARPSSTRPDCVPLAFRNIEEISKIIKNSPTKSCLLDPWPTFLVKDCLDILLPSITKLVNYSLAEGVVPSAFKNAVVTPLIKKSTLPHDELKNYRPVSGLCFLSKLVERVVAKQLNLHVQKHGLDNKSQSAYKAGHSTETALLTIKKNVQISWIQV